MYVRFLQLKINSDYLNMVKGFYDKIVIPKLQNITGCLYACLIQSGTDPNEVVSLTFWNTKKQAEDYEKSGVYKNLLNQIKPFMAESSEWKIQLSDEMELQYGAIPEEPVIKEYSVSDQSSKSPTKQEEFCCLYVRIVSAKISEGKMDEFKRLYSEIILPTLKNTKGCKYAYLTESLQEKNQVISLTIWDSKENADHYEKGGKFQELTDKVKHTFSELYQWKMALEQEFGGRTKSSEDLKLSHYNMVTGRSFH